MTLIESPNQTVEWYTPQVALDFVAEVFKGYDRWKQTTPEDEDEELERRERAKAAREEAAIDALEDDWED